MKYFLISFAVLLAILPGCTKTVDKIHSIHDTTYLDVNHSTKIQFDTVVLKDHSTDTLVKHDTLVITKIVTDTIFKRDTVYQITITQHIDTVLKYQGIPGYAVPATDSVTIYYFPDTGTSIPDYGPVVINFITFTNLIASPDGTFQTFTAVPRYVTYAVDSIRGMYGEYNWNGWIIRVPKMLCSVQINYQLRGGAKFAFEAYTPIMQPTSQQWVTFSPSHVGCDLAYPCLDMTARLADIPLGLVVDLRVNVYD